MTTYIRSLPIRARSVPLSSAARPLRFAGTGGAAAAVQLLLLAFLTRHGWPAVLANGAAFLIAAQINFVLSVTFTWRDRWAGDSLLRRWGLFHASIALMALVNMLTFAATRSFLPLAAASLAGIAAGAVGNYVLGDRLVFRGRDDRGARPGERRPAA